MTESDSTANLLNELAYDYTERLRRGETPPLSEYVERYPQLADQIQELFPTLQVIERLESEEIGRGREAGSQSTAPQLPRQLGEYRVLREVGRGGMGIVYEAIQESLGRHVAVKVLPLHRSAHPGQLERFQREARAAAHLHHHNIVPVFAVGQADGCHYYAMQFIAGQPLDRVMEEIKRLRQAASSANAGVAPAPVLPSELAQQLCTGQHDAADHVRLEATAVSGLSGNHEGSEQLSNPARQDNFFRSVARLGRQAAEALAYAHEQGVLHRDIKPSNLLLDKQGTLWITDFGLARVTGLHELTVPGDVVGTLRYVPPERFRGQTDARGDIYSLGLTLYELLSLQPAFDGVERAELVHSILHTPVTPLRRFDPQVPRDLETIVLHALAREPDQRYPTAAALAEDLRRFLADQPIKARRIRAWERSWRWCRRNPYLAALTTAVAVLSVAALAILTVSNTRIRQEQGHTATALAQATTHLQTAEENYELAKLAIDEYLNRVTSSHALASRDELHELRKGLLEQAVSFYDKLSRQKGDNERAVADRLAAYVRLGTLHRDLADLDAALADFQQAHTLLTAAPPTRSRTATHQSALADVHINLGAVLGDMGRTQESLHEMEEAIRVIDQLAVQFPGEKQHRLTQSKLQHNRCVLLSQLGQLEQALEACEASVRLQSAIVQESPGEDFYAWMLSHSHNRQGMLLAELGRSEPATAAFSKAVEIQRRLVAATPNLVEPRDALAMTLANQANQWMQQGNAVDASHALRESVKMQQDICDEYPSVARYGLNLAHQQISLARALRTLADYPSSLELLRKAADSMETLAAQSDSPPAVIERLATAYGDQAVVLEAMNSPEESRAGFEKALGLLDELVRKHPQHVDYALARGTLLNNLGFSHLRQGQTAGAIACFDRVVNDAATVLSPNPQRPESREVIGQAHIGRARGLYRLGRHAESLQEWDRAFELRVGAGLVDCRVERATAMALAGAADRALDEVGHLTEDPQLPGSAAHNLGRICAIAAASTTDATLQRRHTSRAVDLFRLALQRGFSDLEHLRTSPELDGLRPCAEFQQLLSELEATVAGDRGLKGADPSGE